MHAEKSHFVTLAETDVGEHIEKKNNLSYLSWAWAVDQLLRADPAATWSYGAPANWGETVMVFCTVTAFGKPMTMQLPVMDHRNKAIPSPDAFAVNTAMMRCLVKAIALHGLGLYIYAGEDLPLTEPEPVQKITDAQLSALRDSMAATETVEADFCHWLKIDELPNLPQPEFQRALKALNDKAKKLKVAA